MKPTNQTTDYTFKTDRRTLVRMLGVTAVAGLAGCLGSDEIHGRGDDDELATIEFGDHGNADVRWLVPEEMSPTVQVVEDGAGLPVAVIAGGPDLTYEETIEFYRDASESADWTITDEGGDEEADGESHYRFSAENDPFEAAIEITGFGSRNVTLWIGVEPQL